MNHYVFGQYTLSSLCLKHRLDDGYCPKHNGRTNVPSSQTFRSYLYNQNGPGISPNFRKLERGVLKHRLDDGFCPKT
jgi:hypothetical protein